MTGYRGKDSFGLKEANELAKKKIEIMTIEKQIFFQNSYLLNQKLLNMQNNHFKLDKNFSLYLNVFEIKRICDYATNYSQTN